MILFDSEQVDGVPIRERYQGEFFGSDWLPGHLETLYRGVWNPPSTVPKLPSNSRPRLFVSHRRTDRECALRVAWLGDQHGFDVWLDVLDPRLNSAGADADPLEIATVIEVALLNSTHVCAVITPHTQGSQWVPYEYGRVKDRNTLTQLAACCVRPDVTRRTLPEYLSLGAMHLGQTRPVEDELERWLTAMCTSWPGPCPGVATGDWPAAMGEPATLWAACKAKDDGNREAS